MKERKMSNQKLHECLDKAFDHFNQHLFENELVKCVLNFSRQRRVLGFFMPRAWGSTEIDISSIKETSTLPLLVHEISINPYYMRRNLDSEESIKEIFSTLVHEMCHLWQEDYGAKRPKNLKYHNKEWGEKMISVGLFPSHTGKPGGKKTGTSMSHYIVDDGNFERSYKSLSNEYKFPLLGLPNFSLKKISPKTKNYNCYKCDTVVRGILGLEIICGNCMGKMI